MNEPQQPDASPCGGGCSSNPNGDGGEISRRSFLRNAAALTGGMAAMVAAMKPLMELDPEDRPTLEKVLQKHYKEMNGEEMKAALARITGEVECRYQVRPEIRDIKPMDGVEFVYALNLSRCIGCRKCVHACVAENNQSRSPEIQYIRVLEMPRGSTNVEHGNHHYDLPQVPS